jgi:hypothetical protein
MLLEQFQPIFYRAHRATAPIGGEEDGFLFRFAFLVGFAFGQLDYQPIVVKAQVRQVQAGELVTAKGPG